MRGPFFSEFMMAAEHHFYYVLGPRRISWNQVLVKGVVDFFVLLV